MSSKTISVSMPTHIIRMARRSAKQRSQKFSEWMRDAALERLALAKEKPNEHGSSGVRDIGGDVYGSGNLGAAPGTQVEPGQA